MTIQGSDTPSGLARSAQRLERGRTNLVGDTRLRMDLSTVAKKDLGLTQDRILNSFQEVAEGTRKKVGKATRPERDVQHVKIKKRADTVLLLRQKLIAAERNIARMASDNARLASEKSILEARLHARLHRGIQSRSSASK